jgi:hypothetical protein
LHCTKNLDQEVSKDAGLQRSQIAFAEDFDSISIYIYIYMTQDVGDQKETVLNESRTLQLVAQTTPSCKAA